MTSFFEELWARSVPKLRKLKRGKPYRYCTGIDLLIQIAKVSVTCLFCHCTLATAYSCKIFPQTWTAPCTTPYQHSLPHPGQQPGQHLALNSMLDTVSPWTEPPGLLGKKDCHWMPPGPFKQGPTLSSDRNLINKHRHPKYINNNQWMAWGTPCF